MSPRLWNRGRSSTQQGRSSSSSEEKASDEPDQGENGLNNGQSSSQPVGFWDHRLRSVRLEAFRKWGYTTVVLMIFILAVLSLCT